MGRVRAIFSGLFSRKHLEIEAAIRSSARVQNFTEDEKRFIESFSQQLAPLMNENTKNRFQRLFEGRSRTCPIEALTLYSLPKNLLIVRAFAGDSTIIKFFAINIPCIQHMLNFNIQKWFRKNGKLETEATNILLIFIKSNWDTSLSIIIV